MTEAKSSLDTALADLETKRSTLDELQQVKVATELKLKEAQDSLQALQTEREADDSTALLEAVQVEVSLRGDCYILPLTYMLFSSFNNLNPHW